MTYYETITWDKFNESENMYLIECGEGCSHWDLINQCCWLSWRNKQEYDCCDYNICENEDGVRFVVVTKGRGDES